MRCGFPDCEHSAYARVEIELLTDEPTEYWGYGRADDLRWRCIQMGYWCPEHCHLRLADIVQAHNWVKGTTPSSG